MWTKASQSVNSLSVKNRTSLQTCLFLLLTLDILILELW